MKIEHKLLSKKEKASFGISLKVEAELYCVTEKIGEEVYLSSFLVDKNGNTPLKEYLDKARTALDKQRQNKKKGLA